MLLPVTEKRLSCFMPDIHLRSGPMALPLTSTASSFVMPARGEKSATLSRLRSSFSTLTSLASGAMSVTLLSTIFSVLTPVNPAKGDRSATPTSRPSASSFLSPASGARLVRSLLLVTLSAYMSG